MRERRAQEVAAESFEPESVVGGDVDAQLAAGLVEDPRPFELVAGLDAVVAAEVLAIEGLDARAAQAQATVDLQGAGRGQGVQAVGADVAQVVTPWLARSAA